MRALIITIGLILAAICAYAGQGMGPGPMIARVTATAPAAPTVSGVTNSPAQLTTTWGAVSGATSYNLYYSKNSGLTNTTSGFGVYSSCGKASNGKCTTAVTSPYTINGPLTEGTTYYAGVTAVNSAGESALSNTASAAAAAAVPPLIPSNPGFESAIASSEDAANWWPAPWSAAGSEVATADRLTSATMTGSYVGRIKAQSGVGTDYSDPENPVDGATDVAASLVFKRTKSQVDATNGIVTFDIRPITLGSLTGTYAVASIVISAYNSSGTLLTDDVDNNNTWTLWEGSLHAPVISRTTYAFTPTEGVTVIGKQVDVKGAIVATMGSHTWSEVDKIVVSFRNYNDGTDTSEYYIDNFR